MNRTTSDPLTMAPTTAFSSKRIDEHCIRMHVNDQYEYGGGDYALIVDMTTIHQSKRDLFVQAHGTPAMMNRQFSMQRTHDSTDIKQSSSHTTIN